MRKVKFYISSPNSSFNRLSGTETPASTGFFHTWGFEIVENLSSSVAIIEEEGTGKIHTVPPEWVTFVDQP